MNLSKPDLYCNVSMAQQLGWLPAKQTIEFESHLSGSFDIFMQVYKFYPNLCKFTKFSMTPSLSGNYRQDGIFFSKTRVYRGHKTIVKTPAVCCRLYKDCIRKL